MQLQGFLQVRLFAPDALSQEVAEVPQLVALLADQVQGVVVVGCELVAVQDHHLSLAYQLLQGQDTARARLHRSVTPQCHTTGDGDAVRGASTGGLHRITGTPITWEGKPLLAVKRTKNKAAFQQTSNRVAAGNLCTLSTLQPRSSSGTAARQRELE